MSAKPRMCARRLAVLSPAVAAVLGLVAGCDQAPVAPTTVVVNTPPADGGPLVLLTVMTAVAFVVAGAAVVCAWGWAGERRARRDAETARREAEDAVLALTGQPITHVRSALFVARADGPWQAGDRPAGERQALGGRREVEGWSE